MTTTILAISTHITCRNILDKLSSIHQKILQRLLFNIRIRADLKICDCDDDDDNDDGGGGGGDGTVFWREKTLDDWREGEEWRELVLWREELYFRRIKRCRSVRTIPT